MKPSLFYFIFSVAASAQTSDVLVSVAPTTREEALERLAENKRLSMERQAARQETISDLKQKWNKVESDWNTELQRHNAANQEIEKLPNGPDKAARQQAESAAHRTRSKEIAIERNVVHEGVMQQANRDVVGGSSNLKDGKVDINRGPSTSNEVRQTAGTKVTDPNHRGMNGDMDAGGGYRTTEKVEKILNEMGVKAPDGGKVKMRNGVLETANDFGMTVNADAGADRIGSAGHQSRVQVGAQQGETYISETAGAVQSKPLKDHLATLDHSKKAMHGLDQPPEKLIGGSPEGQVMAKGAMKAATQSGLSDETLEAIARQRGVSDPKNIMDRLGEIKAGRSTITNAEEAAKLQKVSQDIVNASQNTTKAKADAEVKQTETKIAELEKAGSKAEATKLREELADYRAKAKAATEQVIKPTESGGKIGAAPEPTTKTSGAVAEAEPKPTTGSKLMKGAGLALGAYGIYEGYHTAKEEMEAKRKAEGNTKPGGLSDKAELAGRTLWHGLGFGAAWEIGSKAGKDSLEQYKKDIADGKISKDSMAQYGWMKTRAVVGGLVGGVKAITYDAAKQSGTSLGTAIKEGGGLAKDTLGMVKNLQGEKATKEEQSKKIYDMLIKKGASTVGAQRAADGVLKGDFAEAKRLNKILANKQAAKLAAAEQAEQRKHSFRQKQKIAIRREENKKLETTRDKMTPDDAKLHEIVVARLRAANLPVNDLLVNRLIGILKDEGEKGLAAAIKEFQNMQGTFAGSVKMPDDTTGTISITVNGGKVTGTFSQHSVKDLGVATTSRSFSATVSGVVDLGSGAIQMEAAGKVTASSTTTINDKPSTYTTSMDGHWSFRGSYNGDGYKGSTELPWSAKR